MSFICLLSARLSSPIFHVPTKTEMTSGSLSWECLVFISWRSWQKASPFWKTTQSLPELWVKRLDRRLQLTIKHLILFYPCALKRHLPWRVVVAVDHHANPGWTRLVLDNLKDWNHEPTVRQQLCVCSGQPNNIKNKHTSVMWDRLYTEWVSLPVKEKHSCVHVHWHRLSAVTHQLHLQTDNLHCHWCILVFFMCCNF